MPEFAWYYAAIHKAAPSRDYDGLAAFLAEHLPFEWFDDYVGLSQHPPNILRIQIDSFEYLFDAVQLAVEAGKVSPAIAVEDRVVAVHGRSAPPSVGRQDYLMKNRPLGPVDFIPPSERRNYDKGHFMAHSIGGGLEINIFPQLREVNRGWAGQTIFREMETYCATHPGTYCFLRPTYAGKSWHPSALEYGVLTVDGKLWLERFDNVGTAEEHAAMEALLGPMILQRYAERGFGSPPPSDDE